MGRVNDGEVSSAQTGTKVARNGAFCDFFYRAGVAVQAPLPHEAVSSSFIVSLKSGLMQIRIAGKMKGSRDWDFVERYWGRGVAPVAWGHSRAEAAYFASFDGWVYRYTCLDVFLVEAKRRKDAEL